MIFADNKPFSVRHIPTDNHCWNDFTIKCLVIDHCVILKTLDYFDSVLKFKNLFS